MKSVKIVCMDKYQCPYPYDGQKAVPLDVCLSCGGLHVVKED